MTDSSLAHHYYIILTSNQTEKRNQRVIDYLNIKKINLYKHICKSLCKSEEKLKSLLADFKLKKCSYFLLKDYPSKTTSCFILCPEGYPPKPQRMATLLLFSFFSSAFNLAQAASICSFNLC